MKTRKGFVSNSSSSSFIIPVAALTIDQTEKLLAQSYVCMGEYRDQWEIRHDGSVIKGFTCMANHVDNKEGDMRHWLDINGFPTSSFKFEYD